MNRNIKMVGTYLLWNMYMLSLVLGEGIIYQYVVRHYVRRYNVNSYLYETSFSIGWNYYWSRDF